MKANLANTLTWIRIAAIPVVAYCFFSTFQYSRPIAFVVFAVAAITDLLDGYVARRLGQTSKFGEFLDPVADKLMVAVVLVLLVQADPRVVVALTAAVSASRREAIVVALSTWSACSGLCGRISSTRRW